MYVVRAKFTVSVLVPTLLNLLGSMQCRIGRRRWSGRKHRFSANTAILRWCRLCTILTTLLPALFSFITRLDPAGTLGRVLPKCLSSPSD